MHKTVIFDFFEVIHEDPLAILLQKKGLKREGPFADICLRLDLGDVDYQGYITHLAEAFGMSVPEFEKEFESSATLDSEVTALIRELRENGYQTVLLSNTHRDEIQPILTRHQLHDLFDDIIISAEVGMAKPDPEIFHFTLKRLGVLPERAVFTDDNPKNIAGAVGAGIAGIHFTGVESLRNGLKELGLKVN
ncbi:MAG: HAD-IA family hydrolase [Patescibacteria group bacterium]